LVESSRGPGLSRPGEVLVAWFLTGWVFDWFGFDLFPWSVPRFQGATIEAIAADFAMIKGPIQQCHSVLGAGLGEDIADVVVHSALADRERLGNFLVGQSLGYQFDNFELPL
jgi:hypothetical protein